MRPACVQLADYQEALFQSPVPEPYAISQIKARISVRRLDALHVQTLATAFKDAASGGDGVGFLAVRHAWLACVVNSPAPPHARVTPPHILTQPSQRR